jgi:hypothetical protein
MNHEAVLESGCCNGHEAYRLLRGHASASCCGLPRHFVSKSERVEALESYRDQLRRELEGVEERLQDLS